MKKIVSQCGHPGPCLFMPVAWLYSDKAWGFHGMSAQRNAVITLCRSIFGKRQELLFHLGIVDGPGGMGLFCCTVSDWLCVFLDCPGTDCLFSPLQREILGQKESYFESYPVVLAVSQQQSQGAPYTSGWVDLHGRTQLILRQTQESRRARPELQECFKFTFEVGWGMLWKLCWTIDGISKYQ